MNVNQAELIPNLREELDLNEQSENPYTLSADNYTIQNLYFGALGEKIVLNAIRLNYRKRDGFDVQHNEFDFQYEYCCGSGMDLILREGCREIATVEVKNLKMQDRPYGTDYVKRHILPRGFKTGGGAKILIITFLSLLTRAAKDMLQTQNWILIEVGDRLTTEIYRDISKLCVLGSKIKSAISKFWANKKKPAQTSPHGFSDISDVKDSELYNESKLSDYISNTVDNKDTTVDHLTNRIVDRITIHDTPLTQFNKKLIRGDCFGDRSSRDTYR